MPFRDWDDSFRELWDTTPGTDYLDTQETRVAEELFDVAFTHTAEELEGMGYTQEQVFAIRDEFFDYMGMDSADFDWEGWREAMGYE